MGYSYFQKRSEVHFAIELQRISVIQEILENIFLSLIFKNINERLTSNCLDASETLICVTPISKKHVQMIFLIGQGPFLIGNHRSAIGTWESMCWK